MRKFFKWVVIGLGVIWLYVYLAYPIYSARYKMSVEVETPDGVASGSRVIEVSGTNHFKILPEVKDFTTQMHGEALVVEVAPGRFLFILLKADSGRKTSWGSIGLAWYGMDLEAYEAVSGKINRRNFRWNAARTMQGKRLVKPENLPMLVTFTDINDPSTVKRVDPYDLESHFGAGVKLKGATLEITGEKVTRGEVEKVLGWLEALEGGYLHGGFSSRGAPLGLYGGNFKVGD